MKYKLHPSAKVSVIYQPKIKGGNFNLPLNNVSYEMENIMVYNHQSKGGIKPMGQADVTLIKKETHA
jgi:hypothetical protein